MWADDGSDFATIEDELAALGEAVVADPAAHAGMWRTLKEGFAPFARVFVDFGSGMGDFAVELACLYKDALVIGVEKERFCVAKSARKALSRGCDNCVFVPAEVALLDELFAPGEVDAVFLNYPTPHPRARDARLRMVHATQLAAYGRILAPGGFVRLRTDSQPLHDYALTQLAPAGFAALDVCPIALPTNPTGYEQRLNDLGAPRLDLVCQRDSHFGTFQTAQGDAPSDSLFDYLPEDLESLTYVPKDMQRSVQAAIEARARVAENRAKRQQQEP